MFTSRSQKGEKFDTDQLFWDQENKKIYSDKFIRIEGNDRILTGYGFESNQEMTEYRIFNNTGVFAVENTPAAKDTLQQDSIH